MLEEHNFLLLTSEHIPKLRYRANARKYIHLSYIAQHHSSVMILNDFVYRWQMNIITEFYLPIMGFLT